MIHHFCELYGKKESVTLVDSWIEALKQFLDDEVIIGAQKAIEECIRMPVPSDIIKRMPEKKRGQDEETGECRFRFEKCTSCKSFQNCIEEPIGCGDWLCRKCYSKLSNRAIQGRFTFLMNIPSNRINGESKEDRISRHKTEISAIR